MELSISDYNYRIYQHGLTCCVITISNYLKVSIKSIDDFRTIDEIDLDFRNFSSYQTDKYVIINSIDTDEFYSVKISDGTLKRFSSRFKFIHVFNNDYGYSYNSDTNTESYFKDNFETLINSISKKFKRRILYAGKTNILSYVKNEKELLFEDFHDGSILWKHKFDNPIINVFYNEKNDEIFGINKVQSNAFLLSSLDITSGEVKWITSLESKELFFDEFTNSLSYVWWPSIVSIKMNSGIRKKIKFNESSNPFISKSDQYSYFYTSLDRFPNDPRFGKINKQSGIIEWEYILRNEKDEIIKPKDWIQLENGHQVITSTDPVKQTYLFDPDHPDNIPYRTISNGVHIHKNNPFYKPK